jgi:hypothetical protein
MKNSLVTFYLSLMSFTTDRDQDIPLDEDISDKTSIIELPDQINLEI